MRKDEEIFDWSFDFNILISTKVHDDKYCVVFIITKPDYEILKSNP